MRSTVAAVVRLARFVLIDSLTSRRLSAWRSHYVRRPQLAYHYSDRRSNHGALASWALRWLAQEPDRVTVNAPPIPALGRCAGPDGQCEQSGTRAGECTGSRARLPCRRHQFGADTHLRSIPSIGAR